MISFICAIPQEPDDKAFMLSLYDSYYKLMYSIAYKYVSDIQTVDDIVQDSIVSLYILRTTARNFRLACLKGRIQDSV